MTFEQERENKEEIKTKKEKDIKKKRLHHCFVEPIPPKRFAKS